MGRQLFSTVDTLGRVVSTQVDGLDSVWFVYDNKGRLSQEIDGGRTTTYLYNSTSGRLDSLLAPLNRRTGFAPATAESTPTPAPTSTLPTDIRSRRPL